MRPILGGGPNPTRGAFAPHTFVPLNDTRIRESLDPIIVPAGFAPNAVEPAYGTFKDLSSQPFWSPLGRSLGTARFTAPYTFPLATFPLRPRVSGIESQVTNPDARFQQPGYTSAVPVSLAGTIARAIRAPYRGNLGV